MNEIPKPTIRILVADKVHPDPAEMNLCVDAGLSHITLSLLRRSTRRLLGYESYLFNEHNRKVDLDRIFKECPFLKLPFESVCLTYNTPDSVLVPSLLYDPTTAKEVVSLVHGDMPSGVVFQEQVPGSDMCNVYRVPEWLHTAISGRFSNGQHLHAFTALLKTVETRKKEWQRSYLYIWFFPSHVIATLQKDDRLVLMQNLPYDTPEDLSYQLLNLTEQFDLDVAELQIYFSGPIEVDSIIHDEIRKYFLNVEIDSGLPGIERDEVFANHPSHFFTSSLSLCQCGS